MNNLGFQRNTKQREYILKILQEDRGHPTADEIYKKVKKKISNISLGTVYRNLEMLVSSGVIKALETETQRRFDGFIEPHVHIRCFFCNKIDDLNIDLIKDAEIAANSIGFEIKDCRVELIGVCPKCLGKQKNKEVL